jgi:cytokinin dehydrogenase
MAETQATALESILEDLKGLVRGEVLSDEAALEEASTDYGRILRKAPKVVVRPADTADVAAVVRYAHDRDIPLGSRGNAHSQSGPALVEGGIALDFKSMDAVEAVDEDGLTVTCQVGIKWSALVDQLRERTLIPPVLTNNLDVTVGGTLSMAGLGISSFRYGAQVDNVEWMEVVTGTGEVVECTPTQNQEVFDFARAGLGQFALICRARLKVRRPKTMTRTYVLLYDDLRKFMDDSVMLFDDGRFDYLESWCAPCPVGFRQSGEGKDAVARYFFPMHATVEFDEGSEPDDEQLKHGLQFYEDCFSEDAPVWDFARRLEKGVFALWRAIGYTDRCHPWMETILPWETCETYINQVLANLPPTALGGGHILLWPARGDTSEAPLFKVPRSDYVMGFGVLPGLPKAALAQALPRFNLASDASLAMGGKRYLSGWVDFDTERWAAHYGEDWSRIREAKAKFDPKGILNPGFVDYGE